MCVRKMLFYEAIKLFFFDMKPVDLYGLKREEIVLLTVLKRFYSETHPQYVL